MQVCQDIIEHLQTEQTVFVESSLEMRHGFSSTTWKRSIRAESVEVSNVTEIEESNAIKVKSQSYVDHIHQCEGYHPKYMLGTDPDDQSASLQGDPTVVRARKVL